MVVLWVWSAGFLSWVFFLMGVGRVGRRVRFVGLGGRDCACSPSWFYDFVVSELGAVDVCLDPKLFNYLTDVPNARLVYCNPPYSRKLPFIERACYLWKKYGIITIMLLPGDYSTRWFLKALECKASIIFIAGGKLHSKHALFPSMLIIFDGKNQTKIIKITELKQQLTKHIKQSC